MRTRALVALAAGALIAAGSLAAGVVPSALRCEYLDNPLGIDATAPRLSWVLVPSDLDARGLRQTAYQVLVASSRAKLDAGKGDLWDSGKVASRQSVQVVYAGAPLGSRMQCHWKVRAWDNDDRPSAWSDAARWTMGLLRPEDWRGKWIGIETGPEAGDQDAPRACWIWFPEGEPAASAPAGTRFFRKRIELPAGRTVRAAALRLTADNEFTVFVNGTRAGAGGNFNQLYEFDVRAALVAGPNVVAAAAKNVGDAPNPAGLMGVLRIEFGEGAPLAVETDATWRSSDAETAGWEKVMFDDGAWQPAKELGRNGMAPWGTVGQSDFRRLRARYLRGEFEAKGRIARATAHICGLGLCELEVNGRKAGDHVLSPALSEYRTRAYYVTHDVTDLVREGKNAAGVILGNGRYFAPRLKVPTATVDFGEPRLILDLHVEYTDGTSSVFQSDETWRLTARGPLGANSEYDGEEYDARMEMPGWSAPGFDDSAWEQARVLAAPGGVLAASMFEPIRVTETIAPVSVTRRGPGISIVDMGQNIVGWCRIKVEGPAGTKIALRHAEALDKDGSLYLDNIRSAKVTDIYVLKGGGVEVYEPRFTYHGFRYVEVSGWPGDLEANAIAGRVVHDDLTPAGDFWCSNELLCRIYRNICWGLRGNYRSVPTDCPQRDERQGWLGDRSAESRGETYLFDVAAFYAKWMRDIEDAQRPTGSVPDVAPAYWPFYTDNVTWPSSFIVIPGTIHDQYGDVRVLAAHYPAMKKWIDFMTGFVKDDLMPRDTYGDWCVPPEDPRLIHSNDPARKTPGELIATAYFAHDLKLMARYARLVGKDGDAPAFLALAERLTAGLNRKYLNAETGVYANGAQTASVLPLAFDLVPAAARGRVFEHLVEKIVKESKGHVGTGLIGMQWLMRVLSDNGRPDLAYTIAAQRDYPSWGYMLSRDATTIWELWNGDTADPAMNSLNHVMLVGDLLTWMYEYLVGIRPDPEEAGFARIILRPVPVGDLTAANAGLRSPHGRISSSWRIDGGRFEYRVRVPVNTSAEVWVPAKDAAAVMEGDVPAAQARGVAFARMDGGCAVFRVGSGLYCFVSPSFR
ncbi:MAG TPA: alpha-rhamnosidase [Planctomycetes bacterium]|nr:alpha-rhamnosidase [Planctomycetota bacterium]